MKSFRVNEVFYSLQGEGHNTGRAAVFIRFAGCNLRCTFCDTEFHTYRQMTGEQLVEAISRYPARFVVLTGGEPALQVDEAFVDLLHRHGYEVAMESNGTIPAPRNLDWLTVSPKRPGDVGEERKGWKLPDELKVVFDENTAPEVFITHRTAKHSPHLYLQPCDTGDAERNARILQLCIEYIQLHPKWRLSLQTHKLTGIK